MGYRLAVDTGGTFTDVCMMDERSGAITLVKVPSTPDNPSRAVINGVEKIIKQGGLSPREILFFIHGTTVATNALLELKGAKTALITTKGFRDVLQIGRQTRPSLYDFYAHRPKPVIPRYLRYEAPERILYTGEIYEPLEEAAIIAIAGDLRDKGVQAVAVCLMHSYINPAHERKIKEILSVYYPEVFVTLSSEILPEFREYERMSTVCINGYVMPKVNSYLADLADSLAQMQINSDLYVMQSNGGVITAKTARESSARTVLSGPAGGALAGTAICHQTGRGEIITVDMGGTSLDVCLIENSQPKYTTESNIGGYPIKLPMIDINTIGSGGGSIAWIDSGGALRVGPQSAGAVPGPVCYRKGGTEPTVSDANAVLGRLNPGSLLGGDFLLDVERARQVIDEKIAKPLGLTVLEAAAGIIRIVNANMVRGIRVVSIEKGYDPRKFALVPFGGAGPLHGAQMAEELGMTEMIVPPNPGVTSAIGMLTADLRHDYVRTAIMDTREASPEDIGALFESLEEQACRDLTQEGFAKENIRMIRAADMRYRGQAYEITISVDDGNMEDAFHGEHHKAYGYNRPGEIMEIVNLRLTALGKLPQIKWTQGKEASAAHIEPVSYREVFMRDGFVKTAIYNRDEFAPGHKIEGPAIVEQMDSTTLLFPGQKALVDDYGNLRIRLEGGGK